jgi:hypothetical protein
MIRFGSLMEQDLALKLLHQNLQSRGMGAGWNLNALTR